MQQGGVGITVSPVYQVYALDIVMIGAIPLSSERGRLRQLGWWRGRRKPREVIEQEEEGRGKKEDRLVVEKKGTPISSHSEREGEARQAMPAEGATQAP